MFSIGDQIEIVGKFYILGNLLQDVNAETFATAFDVNPWIPCIITDKQYKKGRWLIIEYSTSTRTPAKQTACELNSKPKAE